MSKMRSQFFSKDSVVLERSVCLVTWQTNESRNTGSGWLCSEDGWIITAGHIFVKDGTVFSNDTDIAAGTVSVKFPDCSEMSAKLLYAEKQNKAGIDFAVLSLTERPKKISPLYVNLEREYCTGKVCIVGMGQILQKYSVAAMGYIEGHLVDIVEGNDSFLHIVSENAVQPRYSGAPVVSLEAGAVIAVQAMASESGQHMDKNWFVAESRTVNAMTIQLMIERYPALKEHLIVLKRAFSGFDVLKALEEYRQRKNKENQHFSEDTIDEMILPMIQEQKKRIEMKHDLNQPILDAIHKANDKNCFVLGEEGGSGKTMVLLKLFSSMLQQNTIRRIPIYIELRNLPELHRDYTVYDEPGMLLSDYLASELYDNYFNESRVFAGKNDLRQKLYDELIDPSCHETRYILLLDGLNEVSLSRRQEVCEEIRFWSCNPYTQVIVTSRYKEDALVEGVEQKSGFGSFEDFIMEDRQLDYEKDQENDFLLLVIQKLKRLVILEYLRTCQIPEEMIQKVLDNQSLFEIMKTPMYLTIFSKLYHSKIYSHEISKDVGLADICTRGELLFEFFGEKKLQITGSVDVQKDKLEKKNTAEIRKKMFMFEKIVPYIAYHMAVERCYSINEKNLIWLLDDLLSDENSIMRKRAVYDHRYKTINEIYHNCSDFPGVCDVDMRYGPAERIVRFIVEELHVMKKIQRGWEMDAKDTAVITYEFLHENLRDYFAARQLQEDVNCFVFLRINEGLSLAYPEIPKTVLEFFGDICREHESRPFCDHKSCQWVIRYKSFIMNALGMLRGRHDKDAKVMVSNIISVMRYSRKNDLSGLDFHNIDFSETWLGGIRFSRAYGNTYLSTVFDGATINVSNLLRTGHDASVTCVLRSRKDLDIVYSADVLGSVMQWSCKKRNGLEICRLDDAIRDMILGSVDENMLYIASEHVIYRIALSDLTVSKLYETRDFIWNLRLSDSGISYKTDRNPVVWVTLVFREDGCLIPAIGEECYMSLWLTAHSCESSDGQFLITGGSSKSHRVEVFHRISSGDWNRIAAQVVPLPYGNSMRWIEMSADESRILFCVQKYMYEYSFADGMLGTEIFRIASSHEIAFASYWYNEMGDCDGILYADGAEIVLLDRYYKEVMRLNSGNGVCYHITPLLLDQDYRFSRQNGLIRGIHEKYYLYMNQEVQEFDADTNTCSRIFRVNRRNMLGYCLNSQNVRLFFPTMRSINLKTSEIEDIPKDDVLFIEHEEMRDSVSFSVQNLGRQIIIYDRYTGEEDYFQAYRGLFVQKCSMKNIEGEMKEPVYQEILRRYGAIL